MHPQKNSKFPEDFFINLAKAQPKRNQQILAPIITEKKKKRSSPNPPEDATPYFRPLSKYSSCSNLLKIFDTPISRFIKPKFPNTDTRKVLLPSLKPQIHSKKKDVNLRSTAQFKIIHKKLFSSNQSTDPGVTFSRSSLVNSRESQNLNIFTNN